MPMHLRVEQLPDKSNYYAFFYGPIVLAAKTNTENMDGLFADDSRGGHIAHGQQVPLKDMPIVVSEPDKLISQLQPVANKPLTFKITGLYPEKYSNGLELIPFFRLHESRYIIYWPQATQSEVAAIQQRTADEEQERIKLDAVTTDKVICGEQQPESDHFVKFENSNTGFIDDVHWREAKGWFSYQLKNTNKNAKYLYIRYFNRDNSRILNIQINNQTVVSKALDGNDGDKIITERIELPSDLNNTDILEVKFTSTSDKMATKIVEVRLLNN